MSASRLVRRAGLSVGLSLLAVSVYAQATATQKPFEPTVGQQGKDVVWVPTSQALVEKMLDLAKVTPQDFVMDLGSGDGRTVITAAKRGARAMGIEYNPDMVELSKKNAAAAGVAPDRASFEKADLFETDLSKASVITMFLLPQINLKLRPKILDLKPGTRIVSNTFSMEDWEADQSETISNDCTSWCTALLWIVPAKVAGTWSMPQGALTLTQTFQKITGTLGSTPIEEGRLNGTQISFTAGGTKYTGTVNGTMIQGTLSTGGQWAATKKG
jgi:precorrin-6B methylase 2